MPKTSNKRKPTKVGVSFYLLPEEKNAVLKAAKKEHRTLASYVAAKIVNQAERDLGA